MAKHQPAKQRGNLVASRKKAAASAVAAVFPASTVCHTIVHKNAEIRRLGFLSDNPAKSARLPGPPISTSCRRRDASRDSWYRTSSEYAEAMTRIVEGALLMAKSQISYGNVSKREIFNERVGEG